MRLRLVMIIGERNSFFQAKFTRMDHTLSNVQPPSFGTYLRHCRDTSGLSRADLAAEADTSTSYVAKLEQGAAINPSPERVELLAAALKVNDVQRQHLHHLVAFDQVPLGAVDDRVPGDEITDIMRQLVDYLVPHLAGYVDTCWNVLHPNGEYTRIYRHIADPAVANVLTWFFHVPESRAIMLEWEEEAQLTVAWLRSLMVRHPGSRLFADLLARLSTSRDFRRMWEMQEVLMGRRTPFMWVRDLDHGCDMQLLADVYPVPSPSQRIQLYLGVRTDSPG
jgi:transcriptional regulator with XRE-family HTH domain